MKQRFLLAAAVAAILAFSSCKKDDPVSTGTASGKKLKKITKTEAGVVTVYNLSYNAANKLTSYKSTDNSESIIFSYDAQGNLTGIEQKDHEYKNIYAYSYVNNVPSTGTYKSWEIVAGQPDDLIEDDKLTYTVTNNQVSKIKLEMLQTGSETELLLTYANGNLVNVTGNGAIPYTADFTFGNKKAAYPKVTDYVLDQAGFSLQFAAKHEILSADFDFPGTVSDVTVNTTYTYDSNGYVLTSNDGTAQLVFEYQ